MDVQSEAIGGSTIVGTTIVGSTIAGNTIGDPITVGAEMKTGLCNEPTLGGRLDLGRLVLKEEIKVVAGGGEGM